ncbi:MAG: NPCBM/NEW2 domain-containing protein, partial [Planctomycetia bacterium]|nr:NPCBM/NEW2 domain-containing protein [Planctomycetia bacterium]
VKILDMGLARFEDGGDGLTATEQVMGTVDYMSPEQASDTKHADARADIYSLGCTLWYLLTAKKLYDADSMISRLMKHRDAPLPSLLKERDDAPWPLEQALHKMLAKRPQDRTQTMPDVIAALAPYGGEAPSGSGSSSGLGSGTGHNADMASFMQSMGTSGTNTSAVSASQAKSATKGEVEATEQFSAHDAGTAPKGEALNKGASNSSTRLSKNQAKGSGQRLKLIVAGTLGGMLLLAGIVIKMRDNGGAAVAVVPQTLLPAGPVSTLLPPGEGGRRPDEGRTVSGLTVAQSLDSPDYEWSEPENLGPTINGPTDERAMSLTADQLRIYYDSPSGRSEATRSSSAVPFNKPSKSSGLGESFLSGDGLSMVGITADGSNKYCLKELHRATLDAKWQWDNPRNLCAPAETPEHERHVTMSADGLTLIFTVYNPATGHDVWISRRTSRDGSFGLAEKLGPFVNTQGGTESVGILLGDNQTIVFRRSGVWHFTFTSSAGTKSSLALRSNPFSNDDVWFAPDGRTAYFAADRAGGFGGLDIWVTRLVPKGSAKPKTAPSADQGKVVFLDDLPEKSWSGYGSLGKHGKQLNNAQITWQGSKVEHSLFTATIAPLNLAHVEYEIFGRYDMLRAETFLLRVPVGGPQTFRVLGDGKVLWTSAPQSEPFNVAEAAVNVRNVQLLRLEVSGVPSYSNPLWLNARLIAAP